MTWPYRGETTGPRNGLRRCATGRPPPRSTSHRAAPPLRAPVALFTLLAVGAVALGTRRHGSFRPTVLPLIRQAFLLGTRYAFIDAMTTLSSVIFLVSGRHSLAAVPIFNQASGVEYGSAAAKSVRIVLVTVAIAFTVERRFARLLGERRAAMAVPAPARA